MVGGVAGEDVREAGLDSDADEREASGLLPRVGLGELLVAELDADVRVRLALVGSRERHRHVEVVGARGKGSVENGDDEDGVDGVEHVRDGVLAAERLDALGARGVDLSGRDSGFAVTTLGRSAGARLGALGGVVGDDECVEEVALDEEFRGGRADAAGADEQDAHGRVVRSGGRAVRDVLTAV